MNVSRLIDHWKLPGCDSRCYPRNHSPEAHEEHGYQRGLQGAKAPNRIFRSGPLTLNFDTREVWVRRRSVHVTPTEWKLLSYLALHAGDTCSIWDISSAVWGEWYVESTTGNGKGRRSPSALKNVAIVLHRLRPKLGEAYDLLTVAWRHGRMLKLEEPYEDDEPRSERRADPPRPETGSDAERSKPADFFRTD